MEYLDIVNKDDEVIGKEERGTIYEKSHIHRIVHVLVFNDLGEIALQKRADDASYRPKHWGSTAAGHVKSGETYEQAASRELIEEAGIATPIEFLNKYYYEAEGKQKFLALFRATWN